MIATGWTAASGSLKQNDTSGKIFIHRVVRFATYRSGIFQEFRLVGGLGQWRQTAVRDTSAVSNSGGGQRSAIAAADSGPLNRHKGMQKEG